MGIPADRTVATLRQSVDEQVGRGYRRLRLKIEPGWDEEPVRAVRLAHPDLRLQVDANGAYRLGARGAGGAERLRALDEFGLDCIEQPLAPDDLEAHAHLADTLFTPVVPGRVPHQPRAPGGGRGHGGLRGGVPQARPAGGPAGGEACRRALPGRRGARLRRRVLRDGPGPLGQCRPGRPGRVLPGRGPLGPRRLPRGRTLRLPRRGRRPGASADRPGDIPPARSRPCWIASPRTSAGFRPRPELDAPSGPTGEVEA